MISDFEISSIFFELCEYCLNMQSFFYNRVNFFFELANNLFNHAKKNQLDGHFPLLRTFFELATIFEVVF
jgi:hypothetical protein